jgi:hypothetical protein
MRLGRDDRGSSLNLTGQQAPDIDDDCAGNSGGDDKEESEGEECGPNQDAVLGGLVVGMLDMGFEKLEVAVVGFPDDIEEIAEEGDVAEEPVDADVAEHPPEGGGGEFPAAGFEKDVAGEGETCDIPEAGKKAEERVEANAELGAGDANSVIEKVTDLADLAQAIGTFFGGEHGRLG